MTHRLPNDRLTLALRAMAEEDASLAVFPIVESRLLQEVAAIARARRAAAMKVYAFAAVLVLAVSGSVWSLREPPARSRTPNPESRILATERTTDFFPLHYSNVPAIDVQLVRLEVPRGALASFGLENAGPAVNGAAATVPAEVIIGADGLARAIRFVWPPPDVRREEQPQ